MARGRQAESRRRPFLRLRRKMDLPPTVFMRDRNPCLFLRLRLLGWYVRFI